MTKKTVLLKAPITVFSGPPGSGKTLALVAAYHRITSTVPTRQVLVMVHSWRHVPWFKEKVALPAVGPVQVFSYLGWVRQELAAFWPLVKNSAGFSKTGEPIFINEEQAHYLMLLEVEKARKNGNLQGFTVTSDRVALKLREHLRLAALSCLDLDAAAQRLAEPHNSASWQEINRVLASYLQRCRDGMLCDYFLQVTLYRNLCRLPVYRARLRDFRFLLVDNLEETSMAEQEMISMVLEDVEEAFLVYDPSGGLDVARGASPNGAANLAARGTTFSLGEDQMGAEGTLVEAVAARIAGGYSGAEALPLVSPNITTELRSEMIARVADEVAAMVRKGVPPREIALVAPRIDPVLEFSLEPMLAGRGLSLNTQSGGRRLNDEPLVRVAINLLVLAHPHWGISLDIEELQDTFTHLLATDSVRGALLAGEVLAAGELIPLGPGMRLRLGYRTAENYELIQNCLQSYHAGPSLSPAGFFRRLLPVMLIVSGSPALEPTRAGHILALAEGLQQITEASEVSDEGLGTAFIDLVRCGTVASLGNGGNVDGVVLATPLALWSLGRCFDYQYWLDCGSPLWARSITGFISNPFLLCLQEPPASWTAVDQEMANHRLLACMVRNLWRRSRNRVVLAESLLSSTGQEQEGGVSLIWR